MQKALAGTKAHCPVSRPMTAMMALFAPATTQPSHLRRPTISVERIVSRQEILSSLSSSRSISRRNPEFLLHLYGVPPVAQHQRKTLTFAGFFTGDVGHRISTSRPPFVVMITRFINTNIKS